MENLLHVYSHFFINFHQYDELKDKVLRNMTGWHLRKHQKQNITLLFVFCASPMRQVITTSTQSAFLHVMERTDLIPADKRIRQRIKTNRVCFLFHVYWHQIKNFCSKSAFYIIVHSAKAKQKNRHVCLFMWVFISEVSNVMQNLL